MKTKVRITCDSRYNEYYKGGIGYVDGYCRGGDNIPYAVVVIDKMFVLVPIYAIELYEDKND